jgi:hypothetical protein
VSAASILSSATSRTCAGIISPRIFGCARGYSGSGNGAFPRRPLATRKRTFHYERTYRVASSRRTPLFRIQLVRPRFMRNSRLRQFIYHYAAHGASTGPVRSRAASGRPGLFPLYARPRSTPTNRYYYWSRLHVRQPIYRRRPVSSDGFQCRVARVPALLESVEAGTFTNEFTVGLFPYSSGAHKMTH